MKKFSLFLLFALPFACSLNSCSSDDETEKVSITLDATNLTNDGYFDGMMYYKITSNSPKEVAVNKAEASVIKIEIPSNVKIEGNVYKCTSIAKEAFYKCYSLTTISIPNNVTTIGDYAFSVCSRLASIDIPNSVTSIGIEAFSGCSGLTSINIPNSVTSIGERAFKYCSGITSINIPNSVTSIGYQTFYECSGLTSIDIPNSVTSIGVYSFYGCSGLTSIDIPNGVITIGKEAFYGCSGLTSISIPNSVTSIENAAFSGCSGLKEIHCKATNPPSNSYIFDGATYKNAILYIPKGTLDAYKETNWKKFQNIVEEYYK